MTRPPSRGPRVAPELPPAAPGAERARRNAVKTKPPPPTTQRGQATRRQLKDALARLLQDRAYSEIRLEDITGAAGVRVSLFYHYFQSKPDITQEVLSDMLKTFRDDVARRPRGEDVFESIRYANQRMVELYAANPGAMRCIVSAHEGEAAFAPMWRELTLEWNQRIAASIRRQFPDAFATEGEFLTLAYALAGAADNFLFEYFVHRNPVLIAACPSQHDVAEYLSILWHRTLYISNPEAVAGGRYGGFGKLARPG